MCKRIEGSNATRCPWTALSSGSSEETFCACQKGWGTRPLTPVCHLHPCSIPLQMDPLLHHSSANLFMPYLSQRVSCIQGPLYQALSHPSPKGRIRVPLLLPTLHTPSSTFTRVWRSTAWLPCRVTVIFLLLIVLDTIPIFSLSSQDILLQHVEQCFIW